MRKANETFIPAKAGAIRVRRSKSALYEGMCNFCANKTYDVLILRRDPALNGGLEVRMCDECLRVVIASTVTENA